MRNRWALYVVPPLIFFALSILSWDLSQRSREVGFTPVLASLLRPRSAPLTLWAWEGTQDLSFLNLTSQAPDSVAYYAGTVYLANGYAIFRPRVSPLKVANGQRMCPVFRIENRTPAHAPPVDCADQIAETIQQYLKVHPSPSIQIDYDATLCERAFYSALLEKIRASLPPNAHLAITALASWCLDDRWLSRTCADEVIVMLFSMGRGRDQTLQLLQKRRLNPGVHAEMSIGISANEFATNKSLKALGIISGAKRLYVFNSLPWTRTRYAQFAAEVLRQ